MGGVNWGEFSTSLISFFLFTHITSRFLEVRSIVGERRLAGFLN